MRVRNGFTLVFRRRSCEDRMMTSCACGTPDGKQPVPLRVATLFPNEASLLRLASAVLAETSEDWETGKTYLKLETT